MEVKSQDIKIGKLETFMELLKDNFGKLETKFDKFDDKMDKFIASADERYAAKRTEKNVDRLAWLVISSVVLGVMALIIKS